MEDNRKVSCMDAAYKSFLSAIEEHGMREKISEGTLVGFSGGPDSVLLLHLLVRYRKSVDFPLLAVHVHHGIRGESADRDACFAKEVCKALGVEFLLARVDVPTFAKEERLGTEEAARILRYSSFTDIITGRNDVSTIALGHNATDNLETVIFHLMRGCGTGGLAGIAPVRDNIIRPLISLTKTQILAALAEENIAYVIDETNCDTAYTRNYIRNEILPHLSRISSAPEVSVGRVCRNLICDNDFLEKEALRSYSRIVNNVAERSMLEALHPAIFARVIMRWAKSFESSVAETHIEALRARLKEKGPFSYSLPNGVLFFADTDKCYLEKQIHKECSKEEYCEKISLDCPTALLRGVLCVSLGECQNFSPNIYNFSIKANLRSAIIEGELFVRYRREGDAYFYGGITHKLKKLFNDKKLPLRERETLPVLCDAKGIVWVPGFGVRDDGGSEENALHAAFFF